MMQLRHPERARHPDVGSGLVARSRERKRSVVNLGAREAWLIFCANSVATAGFVANNCWWATARVRPALRILGRTGRYSRRKGNYKTMIELIVYLAQELAAVWGT